MAKNAGYIKPLLLSTSSGLKHVLFFRHSLLNRGGDKMVVTYATQLSESGYDVSIAAAKHSSRFSLSSAVKLVELSSQSSLKTLWLAFWQRQNADVIVADIIVLALALALRNRGKVLYFAQDYDEFYYRSWWMRLWVRLFYLVVMKVLRVPTIAVSDYLGMKFRQEFSGRVAVVKNVINTDEYFPERSTSLVAGKGERKSLLILCRSDWRKGFDVAEAVVARLVARGNVPLEVWTVGENPPRSLCLYEKDFGYVGADELRKIFSSADLFLYPTRHEGFGLMVREAMACGCPVVCTDGVPPEVHGGNARIVKTDDVESLCLEAEQVLLSPFLRDSLAAQGVEFVLEEQGRGASVPFCQAVEQLMKVNIR